MARRSGSYVGLFFNLLNNDFINIKKRLTQTITTTIKKIGLLSKALYKLDKSIIFSPVIA